MGRAGAARTYWPWHGPGVPSMAWSGHASWRNAYGLGMAQAMPPSMALMSRARPRAQHVLNRACWRTTRPVATPMGRCF